MDLDAGIDDITEMSEETKRDDPGRTDSNFEPHTVSLKANELGQVKQLNQFHSFLLQYDKIS